MALGLAAGLANPIGRPAGQQVSVRPFIWVGGQSGGCRPLDDLPGEILKPDDDDDDGGGGGGEDFAC